MWDADCKNHQRDRKREHPVAKGANSAQARVIPFKDAHIFPSLECIYKILGSGPVIHFSLSTPGPRRGQV